MDSFSTGETGRYRGEFLEGVYLREARRFMDWLFFERERLREEYQRALAGRLTANEGRADYQAVIDMAHQLLQLDNLYEEWYRALMQAYALLGNRDAALAQYDLCCQVLAAELGLDPEQETTALYEQIQAGTLTDPRNLAEVAPQFPPFLAQDRAAGRTTRVCGPAAGTGPAPPISGANLDRSGTGGPGHGGSRTGRDGLVKRVCPASPGRTA